MKIGVRQYATLFTAAMGSLFAGSSAMHAILKPDLTIPDYTRYEGDDKSDRRE